MANGTHGWLAAGVMSAAGMAALLGACSSRVSEPARLLRTEDFLADPAASRAVAQSPVLTEYRETAPEQPAAAAVITPAEASAGIRDVEAAVGAPAPFSGSETATAVEPPVLIDAKIGEINGRPVRVDEVFRQGKLEERLIATARMEGMTPARWLNDVHEMVRLELELLLRDELLRAEALASLRPEQRMGLRSIVREFSENARRQAGGSRTAAEQRLREEGKAGTLADMAREQEAKMLVDYQLYEKIRPRVRVSWKDVRLYYERNSDLYNPPAAARLRVIRVPATETEAVATIQAALDSGRPFAEVAALPQNTFNPRGGGLQEQLVFFSGELATADLDIVEPMASTLRSLDPGSYNHEPVDFKGRRGTDKMWVFLESVTQRNRPLSDRDVQREIADQLAGAQFTKEVQQHIIRLMERASFTDLDEMTRRLVEIAAERYWPSRG